MVVKMITTEDNPFNPFSEFDDWFGFDEEKGYHTCAYLGRITRTSPDLSEKELIEETNRAVDEIMEFNLLGIYKIVEKEV